MMGRRDSVDSVESLGGESQGRIIVWLESGRGGFWVKFVGSVKLVLKWVVALVRYFAGCYLVRTRNY